MRKSRDNEQKKEAEEFAGHLDEHYGVVPCRLLGATIMSYNGTTPPAAHQGSLSCCRNILCERENRDCFMGRPMESKNIPFDGHWTVEYLWQHGKATESGCDPIHLVTHAEVPRANKISMLEEFITFPDDMCRGSIVPFTLEEIRAAIAKLKDDSGT